MHSEPAAGLPTRHPTLDESRVIPASRYPCSRPPATQKHLMACLRNMNRRYGMEKRNETYDSALPPHIVQKETMYSKYE